MAILLTVVVYVQTQRIADQAEEQNETLVAWSEVAENVRFVRETVIGDSLTMPFLDLDLRYTSLQGLHFGCTDEEWKRARSWHDNSADSRYVGALCRAVFGRSNLSHADLQGSQLQRAIFEDTILDSANLLATNLNVAWFSSANLNNATLSYTSALGAHFRSTSLIGAVFDKSDLRGSEFIDVDLSNTDLRGARLAGAHFTHVTCDGTLWPPGFPRPADCA